MIEQKSGLIEGTFSDAVLFIDAANTGGGPSPSLYSIEVKGGPDKDGY